MFPCRPHFGIHIDGSPGYRQCVQAVKFDEDCVELSIYCSVKYLEYKELPVKKIQVKFYRNEVEYLF